MSVRLDTLHLGAVNFFLTFLQRINRKTNKIEIEAIQRSSSGEEK